MQQLRQVAHALQRRLGDRARFLERRPLAVGIAAAQGHAHLHLDRGQRLADGIVQLAREASPLLFLRVHEPRRQPLEIAPVLPLGQTLPFDFAVQPRHVTRREPGDDEADEKRQRPRSSADAFAPRRTVATLRCVVALLRKPLQRRQPVDDREDGVARAAPRAGAATPPPRRGAYARSRDRGPRRATPSSHRAASAARPSVDARSATGPRARRRDEPLDVVANLVQLVAVELASDGTGVDQGVAQINRAEEDAGADRATACARRARRLPGFR